MDVANRKLDRRTLCPTLAAILACVGFGACSTFPATTAKSFMAQVERSPDPNVRFLAYEKLGSERTYDNEEQKAEAVAILSKKLERRDPTREVWHEPAATRAIICRSLGKLRHPGARQAILNTVNDTDPLVRTEACRALGMVGKPEDATVLARVMSLDTNYDCRIAAIEGLGELKTRDPRIAFHIANTMEGDEDPAIRYAALGALRKITGKDLGVDPKPWQDHLAAAVPKAAPTIPAGAVDPGVKAASASKP